ncbi:apoptotic chromatin condensation inducer in the nucleus [Phycodurus eques]|uniref:apoptotic chromatin condensation inducer in the nucleus n=1 Tax=Phycodurus eques TaxID=693459 RepID=UPI002ACDB606|nr:apoptotic chromatin condensation inducer in the nucleus [Phycodurus eques]
MADLEDVTLDGRQLQSLRVADLKAALEERGLSKSGQKNALVKRLKGALMLENLQKTSTPHVGLQPNSQIGEEMSQNSLIKQYMAKQQELLRQRLEREAREAHDTNEKEDHTDVNNSTACPPQAQDVTPSSADQHKPPGPSDGEVLFAAVNEGEVNSNQEAHMSAPPTSVSVTMHVPGSEHQPEKSAAASHCPVDSDDDDSEDGEEDDDWGSNIRRRTPRQTARGPSTRERCGASCQPQQQHHIPSLLSPQLRQPTPPPSPPPELSFPLPDTPKQSPPSPDVAPAGHSPSTSTSGSSSSDSRSSSPEPQRGGLVERKPGPLTLLARKMESEGAFSRAGWHGDNGEGGRKDSRSPIASSFCDTEHVEGLSSATAAGHVPVSMMPGINQDVSGTHSAHSHVPVSVSVLKTLALEERESELDSEKAIELQRKERLRSLDQERALEEERKRTLEREREEIERFVRQQAFEREEQEALEFENKLALERERLEREQALAKEQEEREQTLAKRALELERQKELERQRVLEQERLQREREERERKEREMELERVQALEREREEREKALEKERLEREKALEEERKEKEQIERENLLEQERLEREKLEQERLERGKIEQERIEREKALEAERKEERKQERLAREEALKKERQEREKVLEKERQEREEALEKERWEREEALKKEQQEREKALELERLEREKALELERLEREKALELERLEREKALELERLEREKALELERLEGKKALELERLEREKALELERLEKEKALELERLQKEKALEQERLEKEKVLAHEKALELVHIEKQIALEEERLEQERRERERVEQKRLEKERLERARVERERLEKERLERARVERERLEEELLERARVERECLEKERLERARLEQECMEREQKRLVKEHLERALIVEDRLEKESLESARVEQEQLVQRLESERREEQERLKLGRKEQKREEVSAVALEIKRIEEKIAMEKASEQEILEKKTAKGLDTELPPSKCGSELGLTPSAPTLSTGPDRKTEVGVLEYAKAPVPHNESQAAESMSSRSLKKFRFLSDRPIQAQSTTSMDIKWPHTFSDTPPPQVSLFSSSTSFGEQHEGKTSAKQECHIKQEVGAKTLDQVGSHSEKESAFNTKTSSKEVFTNQVLKDNVKGDSVMHDEPAKETTKKLKDVDKDKLPSSTVNAVQWQGRDGKREDKKTRKRSSSNDSSSSDSDSGSSSSRSSSSSSSSLEKISTSRNKREGKPEINASPQCRVTAVTQDVGIKASPYKRERFAEKTYTVDAEASQAKKPFLETPPGETKRKDSKGLEEKDEKRQGIESAMEDSEKILEASEEAHKACAARKISLSSSKSSPGSTDGDQESGSAGGRKRRWGSSTAVTAKKPSISITTDSLKSLIPDIRPCAAQDAVLDLHPEEVVLSAAEDEDQEHSEQDLQIRRTVTQVVSSDSQEIEQKQTKRRKCEDDVEDNDIQADQNRTEPLQEKPVEEMETQSPSHPSQDVEISTVAPANILIHRSISQQKTAVSITIDDPVRPARQPSPARGKVSSIVHISNLVRPFTLGQLKELLGRTGTLVEDGFWIDKIKSHCYVTYSRSEEAVATRDALHGVKWPQSNPKVLNVDFCQQDELDFHKGLGTAGKPGAEEQWHASNRFQAPGLPSLLPKGDQWAEREREMERREKARSEREWDRDKVRDFGKVGNDGEGGPRRSRSRERRRKERGKSKEKKTEKKEKPAEEPPAKLLDDLFRKTKAAPCIYWLPLTDEQFVEREAARAERMKEREKRLKQQQQEEEEKKREEERKERIKGGGVPTGDRSEGAKEKERERERDRDRGKDRDRERERERDDDKRRDGYRRPGASGEGGGRRSRSRSDPRDRRR